MRLHSPVRLELKPLNDSFLACVMFLYTSSSFLISCSFPRLDSVNCPTCPYLPSSPCIRSQAYPRLPSSSSSFPHSYSPNKSAITQMAQKQRTTRPATPRHRTRQLTLPHAATIPQFHTVKTTISVPGTE